MRSSITLVTVALAAMLGGCNDNDDTTAGTATVPPPDLGAGSGTVRVRVAHLSPDAPAVDVCVSAHGANQFMGPVLASAGAPGGLAYGEVTTYLTLPAGAYDVRVVGAGATSCATSVFDATNLPALPAGATVTIAAVGFLHPPSGNTSAFRLAAYVDDTSAPSSTTVATRFIHASPDAPTVTVGSGAGATFMPLFSNVSFTQVGRSTSPQSDTNGYAPLPASSTPPTLTVRASGASADVLTVTLPAAPPGGTVATIFAIGDVGGSPQPLQALVCVDNAPPPTSGVLGMCSRLP